jgi:peroxiredoxin Q/BCP
MKTGQFGSARMVVLIVLMAGLIVAGGAYRMVSASSDKAPAVGAVAPDFTLNSQEGKPVSLGEYRGKWVVLYFYPKDFTSGCTTEAHNFQRDLAQYEAKNAVILGVSVDTADSHQKFCTKEGLNFKLLADTDHKVSEEYGSIMNVLGVKKLSARHTFLVNPQGVIMKEYMDVEPAKHSEEVLAALTELQQSPNGK